MTVLLFLIILSLLIFVHELGHYLAARRSGVAVEEFGFGFPPRLIGWKRGPTIFSLNLIPFGGFVRLLGENDSVNGRPDSFVRASLEKKFFIMAAGVFMNYLLAWVLLSTVLVQGIPTDRQHAPNDPYARQTSYQVRTIVTEGSAAAEAGLRSGDVIRSIDGRTFATTEEVIAYSREKNFAPLTVSVERADATQSEITVTPRIESGSDRPRYGFGIQEVGVRKYPWYVAPYYGLLTTVRLTGETFSGFGKLVQSLVSQGKVSEDLTGPVGIAVLTGQVRQLGFVYILQFIALLSISLAVINFLPLPALDGGRAVFVVAETVRGRPLNRRIENAIHASGFYVLILLLIIISIRDIQRFDIVEKIVNIFR